MSTIAIITAILSFVLFSGFVILGEVVFGQLPSYSAYSTKWKVKVPLNSMNLWSLVTLIVAFLLMLSMLEIGDGSYLQFLGFFAPLYLICVCLTPDWETNSKQHKFHLIFFQFFVQ